MLSLVYSSLSTLDTCCLRTLLYSLVLQDLILILSLEMMYLYNNRLPEVEMCFSDTDMRCLCWLIIWYGSPWLLRNPAGLTISLYHDAENRESQFCLVLWFHIFFFWHKLGVPWKNNWIFIGWIPLRVVPHRIHSKCFRGENWGGMCHLTGMRSNSSSL